MNQSGTDPIRAPMRTSGLRLFFAFHDSISPNTRHLRQLPERPRRKRSKSRLTLSWRATSSGERASCPFSPTLNGRDARSPDRASRVFPVGSGLRPITARRSGRRDERAPSEDAHLLVRRVDEHQRVGLAPGPLSGPTGDISTQNGRAGDWRHIAILSPRKIRDGGY